MKRARQLDQQAAAEIERMLSSSLARVEALMRTALEESRRSEISRTDDVIAQASDMQHEEIQIELMNRRHHLAAQTRAALERLARGEYGICRDCGDFIGLPRLRAIPFAQRCGGCQAGVEIASRLGTRRLAESAGAAA